MRKAEVERSALSRAIEGLRWSIEENYVFRLDTKPSAKMIKKLIELFEKKKIISWIFLVATWITMFYFSSIPGGKIGFGSIWPSIIYHFTIFAGFAFFLMAIIKQKKISKKEIFWVLLITLVFAILDEVHQIFVPGRSAGIQDVLTDLSGAIISILVYYLVKKN